MAIHFTNPKATFIHIPKTGGSSVESWMYALPETHGIDRQEKHCLIQRANEIWEDLGFVFAIVRNPFARYVSMNHFIGQRAKHRIERRNQGLKVKKGTDQETDVRIVTLYDKGFDYWMNCMYSRDKEFIDIPNGDWSRIDPQYNWINQPIDLVLRTENLNGGFKQIQSLFDCAIDLPHLNRSNHNHYRDYYNTTTRNIVEDIAGIDLEKFNYEF